MIMQTSKKTLAIVSILVFFCAFFSYASTAQGQVGSSQLESDISNLQKSAKEDAKNAKDLRKEADIYEDRINEKRDEVVTLQSQINLIENRVTQTLLSIADKEKQIIDNQQEIEELALDINDTQSNIESKQYQISYFIKSLYEKENTNYLGLLAQGGTFSDFFNHIQQTKTLQRDLKNTLFDLKEDKASLTTQHDSVKQKNEELIALKGQLEEDKITLDEEYRLKQYYLDETQASEEKFQELYWRTRQEAYAIEQEIAATEREIASKLQELEARRKAEGEKTEENFTALTSQPLGWPVPNNRGITVFFNDPTYPFRHLFEHSAIDIRAYQGSPVYASADGYVARARDNGMGYSYIMIVHADGLSTVYGHMLRIDVANDQYVQKGEVIGLSGGMPGTPGAGPYSTGPHMHFEVRLNGIPVDPLNYLP
jgi:murein DD-endopeptidase MepM/ murein hydrolase activator NlpD